MGKSAKGTNAVTATGTASVADQIPINRKRAAGLWPSGLRPSGVGISRTKANVPSPK